MPHNVHPLPCVLFHMLSQNQKWISCKTSTTNQVERVETNQEAERA